MNGRVAGRLFRFRRWARFGVWASSVVLLAITVALFGFSSVYGSIGEDVLATICSALLGAIVLLAYAKGYGDDWFAAPVVVSRD